MRNRIVSSANYTGLSENNLPGERLAYYHAEKAKGGVGVTILEEMPVSPATRFALPSSIFAYDKKSVLGFRLLASMVHEHGGTVFGQLIHRGAHAYGFDPSGRTVKLLSSPSQIPSLVSPDGYSVPREMSASQIEEEATNYALTATNLIEAGFDGVEIKCDSSSLPIQFMSPLTNKRSDEYGGSLENRLRFLDRVILEIYEVTNGKKVLGLKMPGDEFVAGGLTQNDMQQVAIHLERLGKIDYIGVGAGNLGFDPDYNTPSAYYPQGLFVHLAEGIKNAISSERVKIMALGRITEPAYAETILSQGKSDMVIMMRALIADPELPNKAREGRLSEIVPCIGCNQGCLGHVLTNRPTSCILNPVVSREKEWGKGTLGVSSHPKRIMIVGGGPAGMECARVAASRGHVVTIYERSNSLGGQMKLASLLPGRTEFSRAIAYWEAELARLGVKVHLNVEAPIQEISGYDVVVDASGIQEPSRHGYSPAFSPPEGSELLKDAKEIPSSDNASAGVVVYDDRGDFEALGWAEFLADHNKKVTMITRNSVFGQFVEPWSKFTSNKRLFPKGVEFVTDSFLKRVTENSVTFFNIYSKRETTIQASSCYFDSWPLSSDEFRSRLSGSVKVDYQRIGDCVSPRSVEEAVYEGHKLGREL